MPAFENALMLVADTNDPTEVVPNRYAVTGQASSSGSSSSGSGSGDSSSGSSGDSTSWISGHEIHTYFDQTPGQVTGDIVWRGEFDWGGPGAHYNIIVEYAVNSTMLTGPTSAWGQFSEDPDAVLNAGVNGFSGSPWGTDEFSPHSMWYGAETLKEAGARLDYWRQNFTQWANDVDSNDSDFQGSAAGVFRQTLMSFANMLQALSEQFAAPKFVSQLASLENVMNSNVTTFRNKVDAWMSDSNNSPSTILQNVFENVMSTANVEYGFSASQARVSPHINTSYGDPANDSFWTQVDSVAKQQWLATLGPLDDAAQEFLSALDYAYQQTDAMMPSAFMPPPALTPPGTGDDGTNGGNGGNGGPITLKLSGNDGSTGGSNGNNGNGGNINLSGLNSGNSGGNGNNGGNLDLGGLNGGGLGGGGGNSGGLGGPGNLGNFLTTGGNSGSGGDSNGANLPYLSALNTTGFSGPGNGGGQSQVLGPGGQPLTDGSGGPLTVPSGSSIGPNGSVIGPNGQPVLGPNGQPLQVPPGSSIGSNTGTTGGNTDLSDPNVDLSGLNAGGNGGGQSQVLGPGGQPLTDGSGGPLTVPSGSSIGPNGSVIGPNGQPVLGPNGQPLQVPPGSSIGSSTGTTGGSGGPSAPNLDLTGLNGGGGQNLLVGPNGQPLTGPGGSMLTVPSGSTIGPNGSVIGPNGQPVLGSNGQPLQVPQGSSIGSGVTANSGGGPNGGLGGNGGLGPNLDLSNLNSGGSGSGFNGLGGNGGSGLGYLGSGTGGSLLGAGSGGGGGGAIGGGGGGFGRLLNSSTETGDGFNRLLGPDSATNGGSGGEGSDPNLADDLSAQEQSINRVATVGGNAAAQNEPPMMPPMGGMGGVGGGGGPAGSKKTWITEAEETWGTTAAAGTGVIGR